MEHAAAALGVDSDKVWQVNWGEGSAELKSVGTVVAHTANCTNIAIDAAAKHFATGAYDGTVCIWLCTALHMQVCRGAEEAAASPRNRARHAIEQASRPCALLYVGLPEWPDRDAGEVACLRPACSSLEEVSLCPVRRAMGKRACRPVPCIVPSYYVPRRCECMGKEGAVPEGSRSNGRCAPAERPGCEASGLLKWVGGAGR
jgi:hypothetical protein